MNQYTDEYRDAVTEMPELWRVYAEPLRGTWLQGWFYQFDVPTEVIIGGGHQARIRYPTVSADWRSAPNLTPRQGRVYGTDFRLRPDGIIEPWWEHNDGKGQGIECQEVFEDQGDDGHTDYHLIGYRYVVQGTDPWAHGPMETWR